MHLNGLKLQILERADECARTLTPQKCGLDRSTPLTGGDRGLAVAFVELVEVLQQENAKLAKRIEAQDREIASLKTAVFGTGETVLGGPRG